VTLERARKPETATAPQDSRRTEPGPQRTGSRACGQGKPLRERVHYRCAGAAQRQATVRAALSSVTALLWRVLCVVFYLTTSYSKLTDRTSARQIAALVYGVEPEGVMGSQRERVSRALNRLADLGIIQYNAPLGGRYAGLVVTVPVDPNVACLGHVERTTCPTCLAEEPNVSRPRDQHPPRSGQHLEVSREVLPRENGSQEEKSDGVSDVRGFFDVVREQTGIELEPTRTLVDEIRARMNAGYSARHVGGEVDARSWPAELDSPEAIAIYRLRKLEPGGWGGALKGC
jgi:hypothetical protein